ncbi:hypothetical protein ACWN8V_09410 [Vagococcus elongatus]|nr:hypothetical protein [Vagococcus elongatus]
MLCPNCGEKATGKFCSNCGTALKSEDTIVRINGVDINLSEIMRECGDARIKAIKSLRSQTGLGLTDAKEIMFKAYEGKHIPEYTHKPNQKEKKSSLRKRLVSLLMIVGLVGMVFIVVTGKIKYYETLRLAGESRGYIGRESKILESQEGIEQVFNKLRDRKEFEDGEIYLYDFSLSNERIYAIIQDTTIESNFDRYAYNGTRLFRPSWSKGDPINAATLMDGKSIDINDLSPQGIHRFYTQINNYLDKNNVELPEDHLIQIRVHTNLTSALPELTSSVSGLREDLSFKSDLDGDDFEVKDQ